MRDDFTKTVRDKLAKRVGFLCSNPFCRKMTVAGGGVADVICVGEAAHMVSAAPNGPRSDSSLSSEERSSESNGIWLCVNCATIIDRDARDGIFRYPLTLLRDWKAQAEQYAKSNLGILHTTHKEIAVFVGKLTGHQNFVWDVVVTPDNRCVLSASNDKTVRLSLLASKLILHVFRGHEAYVCSLAVTPDGRSLAAGAADGAIKVWDLLTYDEVVQVHHGSNDAKVSWQPNSEQLVSGGADGRIRIWKKNDGQCIGEIAIHEKPILKVVALANSTNIVSVSADRTVRVCCSKTGRCVRVFEGHTGEINSVAVFDDGRSIISASEDKTLRVWNLDSGENTITLRGHMDVVWRVAVDSKGKIAASGSGDNLVLIWDLVTGECLQRLEHPDCVAAVAFSPDGATLVVGCDDHNVYLYQLSVSPPV